jgi:hypothetical protein
VAGLGWTTEAAALAARAQTILAARLPIGHPYRKVAAEAAERYRRSA